MLEINHISAHFSMNLYKSAVFTMKYDLCLHTSPKHNFYNELCTPFQKKTQVFYNEKPHPLQTSPAGCWLGWLRKFCHWFRFFPQALLDGCSKQWLRAKGNERVERPRPANHKCKRVPVICWVGSWHQKTGFNVMHSWPEGNDNSNITVPAPVL